MWIDFTCSSLYLLEVRGFFSLKSLRNFLYTCLGKNGCGWKQQRGCMIFFLLRCYSLLNRSHLGTHTHTNTLLVEWPATLLRDRVVVVGDDDNVAICIPTDHRSSQTRTLITDKFLRASPHATSTPTHPHTLLHRLEMLCREVITTKWCSCPLSWKMRDAAWI